MLKWLRSPLPLILAAQLRAQPAPAPILVPFHVVKDNRSVTTLAKDDFILLEDGVAREITQFRGAETRPPVELIFLLDTTTPATRGANPDIPDPFLNLRELAGLMADPGQEIRASVYGYSSGLKRFCPPTRDVAILRSGFAGAMGVPYLQQHEIPADAFNGLGAHPSLPMEDNVAVALPVMMPSTKVIPSPGKRVPGVGSGHGILTWNEALIATAQAVAREPSDAVRIFVPLLNGLPAPDWDAAEVGRVYQQLGFLLYPKVRQHAWILGEKRALTLGRPDRPGSPAAPGLDWKKMTNAEKLSWLDEEDKLIKSYEALSEQTGGDGFATAPPYQTVPSLLAAEIPSIYVAAVNPHTPGEHKIEMRLRDENLGRIVGGTR
jgi:hypothetical protein